MIDAETYGPWAVIAGGSEGVGACLAARLARAGINLVLIARKQAPLDEVARSVRAESGIEIRTLALDLTRDDLLDQVRSVTDDIDVGMLVYNAGAAHRTGPFLDAPLADALHIVRLNAIGHTTLCHHFGTKLAARRRGGIIIIGSMAGNAGSPSVIAYAGAKAFAQIFAEGLWWELKQHGVDVLHMVIGPTDTPAMARMGIDFSGTAVPPDTVAGHALDNITNGPVFVMPELAEGFEQFATIDRRAATELNAAYVMGHTDGSHPSDADG